MANTSNQAVATALSIVFLIWAVNGVYLSYLSGLSLVAFWVADFTQWVVLPVALIYWLVRFHGVKASHFGLSISQFSGGAFILGFAAALSFFPAFFWIEDTAYKLLGPVGGGFSLSAAFPDGPLGTVLWIYSAVTAGVVESIFFIGLPWCLWSQKCTGDKPLFVAGVSAIFAIVHWEQGLHVVIGAFAFSVIACVWYLGLKNLWPVVLGHVLIDLAAFA